MMETDAGAAARVDEREAEDVDMPDLADRPERIEHPLGDAGRAVAGRCVTPFGLGAARRLEVRPRDNPQFMRYLRQNTVAATKRMPRNSMARFHLALILHQLGDLARAHVEFQRALECAKSWLFMYMTGETIRHNPRTQAFCARITAHVIRVAVEMQGDHFATAQTLAHFGDAFRWDASLPHIWNDLALMHLQAGECEAARVVLETVVAHWPAYVDALANLALALLGVGQTEAAVRALQATLVHSRSHVEALNNYATVLIEEQREPRLAVAVLRAALEWDATQPAVWSNLSVAYSRIGKAPEACAALARACELAPEWDAIWLNAASLIARVPAAAAVAAAATAEAALAAVASAAGPNLRGGGKGGGGGGGGGEDDGEEMEAGAQEEAQEAAASLCARARLCLKSEEVEARIEAQAELLPDARAWAALADARMRRWKSGAADVPHITRQELRDDCLKASAKALSLDEGNVSAWMQLGLCALHDGRYAKAQGYFLQVLSEQPKLVSGWCNLGMSLQLGGQGEEARKAYLRGLEMYPGAYQLLNNLANLYRQRGDWAKAEDCYFKAIHVNPGFALAYNNLALLYIATGHAQRAIPQLQRALALEPGLACALSNLRKVEILIRTGGGRAAGHAPGVTGKPRIAKPAAAHKGARATDAAKPAGRGGGRGRGRGERGGGRDGRGGGRGGGRGRGKPVDALAVDLTGADDETSDDGRAEQLRAAARRAQAAAGGGASGSEPSDDDDDGDDGGGGDDDDDDDESSGGEEAAEGEGRESKTDAGEDDDDGRDERDECDGDDNEGEEDCSSESDDEPSSTPPQAHAPGEVGRGKRKVVPKRAFDSL